MKAGIKSDALANELLELLVHLEQVLKECGIWSKSIPSSHQLKSTEPFCVDTMSFENWLQFVMIPTFKGMVFDKVALPSQCEIAPMAGQVLMIDQKARVISVILSIDKLLTVS
ncbi:MAG: hypothetical protein ACJA0E_000847 [Bermanella sp.]|jgi:uncharacterized protein YqcC (DUF446 family)